jgi:tRNA-dihydrouridine synthase
MICKDLGFDGIDINMGCPETNVNNQGSGAALILNPPLAQVSFYLRLENWIFMRC